MNRSVLINDYSQLQIHLFSLFPLVVLASVVTLLLHGRTVNSVRTGNHTLSIALSLKSYTVEFRGIRDRIEDMRQELTYSPAEKAKVLEELALGKRPVQVAEELSIPPTTIYEWRTNWINDGTLEAFTSEMEAKTVAAMAVDLLKDQFEIWLRDGSRLSPQQIGILYGITTDKVIAFDKLKLDRANSDRQDHANQDLLDILRAQAAIGNPVPPSATERSGLGPILEEPAIEGEVRDLSDGTPG